MAADFTVITEECMFCGAPPEAAQNLMDMEIDENGYEHCYFRRQPENDAEVDEAIAGMNASCSGAVCYIGNDEAVLQKIRRFTIMKLSRPLAAKHAAFNSIVDLVMIDRPWISIPKQGLLARLFKRRP